MNRLPSQDQSVRMRRRPPLWALLLAALGAAGVAVYVPSPQVLFVSIAAGASLVVLLLSQVLTRERHAPARTQGTLDVLEADASPAIVTDDVGEVIFRNAAARERFGEEANTIALSLSTVLTNPTALAARLAARAERDGNAREDIVTRSGHLRLTCHGLETGETVWRIDDLPARASETQSGASEILPLVVLGRNETVLFMNEHARRFFGERPKRLSEFLVNPPLKIGQVQSVAGAEGPLSCVVTEGAQNAGRRELIFVPVSEGQVELPAQIRFFDELPVPLIKLTPDGTVTDSNRMARALFGRDDVVGESLGGLLEGLGRSIKDWLHDTMLGRVSRQSEFLKVKRADAETFVQVTLKPALDSGEDVLVGVLSDATELKTLEAQFVQSQKMQAIGQLAGGVAHDFNNLLTAISGHCDLLMMRCDEADPDFADLEQINQNANRAAALVSQLLAFSRKQTLRPQTIDIQETLSELTHLLGRLVGETVMLEFEHATEAVTVRADKRQIEQVMMNLVVNARDAMPGGGTVRIRTEALELNAPMKRDRAEVPPGSYVSVKVIDEGSGIPPDKLEKIFEPFFTTKRTGEGTGLGLSTAYGIVKQTGGFIFADSTVGEGSCFTLILPAHTGDVVDMNDNARGALSELPDEGRLPPGGAAYSNMQAPAGEVQPGLEQLLDELLPARSAATGAEPSAGARAGADTPEVQDVPHAAAVLLVEDEAPVRAFAGRALKLKGFHVIEAASGEEALDIVRDEATRIDAFVTDVIMPGMTGPEWVLEARKLRPDVSVVFMSGYAEDAFGDGATAIESASFLQKPFSLAELSEMVETAVEAA